ncbi:sulfite reductase subunit alpha [Luteibacter sp. UNCMF366Tsu5.1]|uniref:sulfite reductase subunit alpha n=1 Tax=Luteibacter sp. UNCMF366Tsu5.1 TaxID=1502758 RepID=UPI0009087E5F|nr:sulfite reductase subunit alpha [Luteibacter sp. UNCMF366Tsu5.1]SFW38727.1 sulfite reductase (NADPH) flavoprotein alpha-component [Luteibacter sp. UNCMF366Tsu5.1]
MNARIGQAAIGALLVVLVLLCWHLQDSAAVRVTSPPRMAWAGGLALAWMAFVIASVRRSTDAATREVGGILVVHASQTGFSTELAERTAAALKDGGLPVDLRSLDELTLSHLTQASQALFIASTTGEGDAPDVATLFHGEAMRAPARLRGLAYGVLALGDRDYDDFCAFGRELDGWLRASGASPLFDRVDVDNGDEGSLRHWQHHVAHLAGTPGMADWVRPAYQPWRLVERRLLNPGSLGGPCFHLALIPADPAHMVWAAGDIAEVGPRAEGTILPHREYSIASVPEDGALHLVVRQVRGKDGALGLGSGWLTERAPLGGTIDLRVRRNPGFHAPSDDRPLLLIGNGTGIAGLRALLKTRIARAHRRNWVIFGERQAAIDRLHVDELEAWSEAGHIERLDLVWSRDAAAVRYVQHRLRLADDALRQFVRDGASIHVCGSLDGMAPGVDAALRAVLGDATVNHLAVTGRYRRDVY